MTEALLIGIGRYDESSFQPLPATAQDVEALQEVLRRPDIGASRTTDVTVLVDPTLQHLKSTIETFCTLRTADEPVLIYFSGYGIIDDQGQLFFPCRNTSRSHLEHTAYSLTELQTELEACRSQQQIIMLDCCFSGTYARGMIAPTDIDKIGQLLSSKRRALFTSPWSIDYSPKHKSSNPSTYTQYLLNALETGMADGSANQPLNGEVSVLELHDYIRTHLEEDLPAMYPRLYSVGQGYNLIVAHAPYLEFRQEAMSLANRGEISIVGHNILEKLRVRLGIPQDIANEIKRDALLPYQHQAEKRQEYEAVHAEVSRRETPLSDNTQAELLRLREISGIEEAPVTDAPLPLTLAPPNPEPQPVLVAAPIEAPVEASPPVEAPVSQNRLTQFLRDRQLMPTPQPSETETSRDPAELIRYGLLGLAVLGLFIGVFWAASQLFPRSTPFSNPNEAFSEGVRRAQRGDHNGAIEAYDQAINLRPDPANREANVYYNRGLEYANKDDLDRAISDYNKAIELDPSLADAYFNRANVFLRRGDRDGASTLR